MLASFSRNTGTFVFTGPFLFYSQLRTSGISWRCAALLKVLSHIGQSGPLVAVRLADTRRDGTVPD